MKLQLVEYDLAMPDGAVHMFYEIVAEPISFDIGEGHVELGGELVALKNGEVYQVFGSQFGPTFAGLWGGCTFHLVVRSWQ